MDPSIAPHKAYAEQASKRFLNTLSHVPDDKLTWKPAPTAKSALQVAAHVALSYRHFAKMLSGDTGSPASMEEVHAAAVAAEQAIATRDAAVRQIEQGTAEVVAVLESLTPEQIAGTAQTPFGSMPMTFMVALAGRHTDNHAAQIDYLQSMWGDTEFHV